MNKKLSAFMSVLLCLVLIWTLIPVTPLAEEDEDLAISWGDNSDGYFMAASDEADFGDVYRACPYVTRKFSFYWSQDGDPDHRDSDVTVTMPDMEDSCFHLEADGNQLTAVPEKELLPGSDGAYSETVTVYLSRGDYETAERKQEIRLTFTMNIKNGDPVFEINNKEDLISFASLVNSGYTYINAVLASDITLNDGLLDENGQLTANTDELILWTPIGYAKESVFEGVFDGSGHTISGLYMNSNDALGGLFGILKGTVKNVRIDKSWIEVAGSAGAVTAWNQGTIQNVSVNAYVKAGGFAGGIAGMNEGWISRCYAAGTVELSGSGNAAGPVCGSSNGTIDKAFYLAEEETDDIDGTQAMNMDQFASGELCWQLNEGLDVPVFFQNLGEDGMPVLDDTHWQVYCGYQSCMDTEPVYTNSEMPGDQSAHKLTQHEAIEPGCTEAGNSVYWSCEICGRFFSDPDGITEIAEDSWILPALNHDYADGICTRCGEKDPDAPETQAASQEPETQPASQEPETQPASQEPATQPASQEPATQPASQEPVTQPTVIPTVSPAPTAGRETEAVPVTVPESATAAPTAPTEYMISISDDGHGSGSANPAFASTGVTVTLTAKPNDGYQFKEWQVLSGGVRISDNKFTVGYDNVEIKVLFEKIPAESPGIAGGNGSMWVEGSDTSVKLTCDGDFYSFTDLKIDGSVVAKKNYTASAGSVVVELKPEYLNTLEEGRHNAVFVFGNVESDEGWFLVIAQKEDPVSKVNVILWIIIIAAALSVIATTIILIAGRNKEKREYDEDDMQNGYY